MLSGYIDSAMHVPVFSLLLVVADDSWLMALADSFWTYVLLGASAIITEELSPVFGGIAAHEGELRLLRVVVSLTLGGWIATALLYALGRWRWEAIRKRFPKARTAGTVALRVVRNNPLKASFFVRFAFGLRLVLPMACGAARVPILVYLTVSLAGSLAWAALFSLVGYAAGEAAVQFIGPVGRLGEILGALALTAAILFFFRWQRQRRERRSSRNESRQSPDIGAQDRRDVFDFRSS